MTPDRMAYLAQCEREAAAKTAPDTSPQDGRTHQDEMLTAHVSTTVAGATPASGEGHGPWPRRPI
jgi:hypothetical protein